MIDLGDVSRRLSHTAKLVSAAKVGVRVSFAGENFRCTRQRCVAEDTYLRDRARERQPTCAGKIKRSPATRERTTCKSAKLSRKRPPPFDRARATSPLNLLALPYRPSVRRYCEDRVNLCAIDLRFATSDARERSFPFFV